MRNNMLTKKDITNIVTGMLVTNQNKTDQEKSELIIDFLDKEDCLKVEKEEEKEYDKVDLFLNVLITIATILAYDLILHILFEKYKTDLMKDMSNLEQIFINFLFIVAFVLPFIFMYQSIKQKKWKQIEKK